MSYEDRKRSLGHEWGSDEADDLIARRSVSPGKRTLTMSLPPRATSSPASVQVPVQQKADPAAVMQRKEQSALTAQWMDMAVRPDLHDAPVQRKSAGDEERDQGSTTLPASGGGKAMPEEVQAKMEGAFGADFSAVRIHEGPQATAMGALAYTQGTDIHFAPGQYNPGDRRGQELLGHELTHVVQQSQGRVQATTKAKGVDVNDDRGLEREADVMGARAARGETTAARMVRNAAPAPVAQCKPDEISGREGDAGTNEHDDDVPPDEEGLSPRARAMLRRLNLRPQLPPEVLAKLSRGLEQIAEQAASFSAGAKVGEELSFHVTEGDWQLALRIGVEPRTGSVQIDLAFKDGETTGFIGSFSTTPPQAMEEATLNQPAILDREISGPELSGIESPPVLTPLDVARFLIAESTEMQLAAQGEDSLASPESDSAEQARLEAELKQTEAEIAAAEKELLQLAADTAIDLAGIVDPTPISDGIAMARDLSRGDYFGAVLSGVSMIPWLGDALAKPVKGARILDKVNDVRKLLTRLQKRAGSLRKRLKKPSTMPNTGTGKLPEVPDIKAPKLDHGDVPGTGPNTPTSSSDAKNRWRKEAHDKRTSDGVKKIDQPLENPNPHAAHEGHGHVDHGAQTTDIEQAHRVETGETPSGRTKANGDPPNPPSRSSRFRSPEAELEARGRALRKLQAEAPPKLKSDGTPNRHAVIVETNNPRGFGEKSYSPKRDAHGNPVKRPDGTRIAEEDPGVLERARVVFEYVPSKDSWEIVTQFPIH